MCYNPNRLLCVRGKYKGVVKTCILFRTYPEEFERGFATRELKDLPFTTLKLLKKIFPDLSERKHIVFDQRIELPCRKCLDCTRNRAKEWSVRCQLEAMQYDLNTNFMVTLTYNDSNLPLTPFVYFDSESDSYKCELKPNLEIKDCQRFMKSLRKHFERLNHTGIRFFSCGEYGGKNHRPHYHFVLFNLPLNDLYFWKMSKTGFPLYRSKTLEKCWSRGFVTVQPFSVECARYVAQYCCKKLDKKFVRSGLTPEFLNMSRRPGIGMNWFYKNMEDKIRLVDGIPNDHLFLSCKQKDGSFKSLKFRVPSAFTRIFKPVTDSKRDIDTEFKDVAFFLNYNDEMFVDAMEELKLKHMVSYDNFRSAELAKYGFTVDDYFSDKAVDFFKIKELAVLRKFKPCRNEVS